MYVSLSQTYTYTNMHTLSCLFITSRCERVCMVQSPSACEVVAQRYTLKFALDKSENDLKAALSMYVCMSQNLRPDMENETYRLKQKLSN